jgi:hypothetical protein
VKDWQWHWQKDTKRATAKTGLPLVSLAKAAFTHKSSFEQERKDKSELVVVANIELWRE